MNPRGRRRPARLDLPDGYYWLRVWINLRGGGHVGEWKIARVFGGRVQVLGPDAELDGGCEYLEHAQWVRIDPPDGEATAARTLTGRRRPVDPEPADAEVGRSVSRRVRAVAEGIVGAFLSVHESAARHYDRHPEHRTELIDRIARLIEQVRD